MNHTLIIDNGSGYIKSGLATDNSPSFTLPSLIGKAKFINTIFYQDEFKKFRKTKNRRILRKKQFDVFGKEASESLGLYNLTRPIIRGDIVNVEDLEKFYEHLCFEKLKMDVSEISLLLTENLNAKTASRQNLVEMIFERMRVILMFDLLNKSVKN